MSYLALCRGSPATGDAIPGLRLKVLSTIVGERSGDSRDGDQALDRSKAHGRRDQKQVRALTWRKGHSPSWGMWEPDGEGHRWEGKDYRWACSLGRGSHCLPGFQKLCGSTVSSSYFGKRALSWEAPPLPGESAQSLSGSRPGCQVQSRCVSIPGPVSRGRGLPLSALVPCSGAPNQRHAVQLCARTPLWQETGQ